MFEPEYPVRQGGPYLLINASMFRIVLATTVNAAACGLDAQSIRAAILARMPELAVTTTATRAAAG